jgi:hypothetical protein
MAEEAAAAAPAIDIRPELGEILTVLKDTLAQVELQRQAAETANSIQVQQLTVWKGIAATLATNLPIASASLKGIHEVLQHIDNDGHVANTISRVTLRNAISPEVKAQVEAAIGTSL